MSLNLKDPTLVRAHQVRAYPSSSARSANWQSSQISSHKGGDQWKGKTERYLMSVVPAVCAILAWAEKEEDPITQGRYELAVGAGLTTYDRAGYPTDHSYALNSAIWGFLSNCLSGEAKTIFKKADALQGVEAWRRISRFIDHGREIRPRRFGHLPDCRPCHGVRVRPILHSFTGNSYTCVNAA